MAELTPEIDDICEHCNQPIFKSDSARPAITLGVLSLNPMFQSCALEGVAIHLTKQEFLLLYFLASRAGKVCSKDTIFTCVWSLDSDAEIKIVDVIVCKLRKKLGDHKTLIETHWGRGYSMGVIVDKSLAIADNVLS